MPRNRPYPDEEYEEFIERCTDDGTPEDECDETLVSAAKSGIKKLKGERDDKPPDEEKLVEDVRKQIEDFLQTFFAEHKAELMSLADDPEVKEIVEAYKNAA
jgi:hypothetical protein